LSDEVGLTVSPAYTAGMFGDLYGDLLSLIKPALDEMVCEGFAVGWQIDMVKRDYVEFRNEHVPGVVIVWDGSAAHRWMVESGDRSGRGATLALAASAARTVGIKL
jgi:hypothetical protein